MPHHLFLIHGMGTNQAGWEKPFVETLEKHYGSYKNLAKVPFKDRFTIAPVTYDDTLRGIVEQWQAGANAVAKDASPAVVQDLTAWLRRAGDTDGNFGWTHASDVLLYRVFTDVRDALKVHVAKQIAGVVRDLKAGEPWSVIGYSLGTAVGHDALHALWTDRLPDGSKTGFNFDQARALVVAQIANVSRVLQSDVPVYQSTVKPGVARDQCGCSYFLTARHVLDPFTTPAPFSPVAWPTPTAEAEGIYRSARPEHIHDWNIHAFEHYLVNPDVHIPLFRMLMDDQDHLFITDADEQAARAAFKVFGDLPEEEALKIKSWLESRVPAMSAGWQVLPDIWDWFELGEHHFA